MSVTSKAQVESAIGHLDVAILIYQNTVAYYVLSMLPSETMLYSLRLRPRDQNVPRAGN